MVLYTPITYWLSLPWVEVCELADRTQRLQRAAETDRGR